jgi:hypothetical protein
VVLILVGELRITDTPETAARRGLQYDATDAIATLPLLWDTSIGLNVVAERWHPL